MAGPSIAARRNLSLSSVLMIAGLASSLFSTAAQARAWPNLGRRQLEPRRHPHCPPAPAVPASPSATPAPASPPALIGFNYTMSTAHTYIRISWNNAAAVIDLKDVRFALYCHNSERESDCSCSRSARLTRIRTGLTLISLMGSLYSRKLQMIQIQLERRAKPS